ncbi:hypothetical protein DERP_006845 [Dermatophagoides pteronyssinus]|uniref:Uncharacterized protein n=1 Tax=Dermatophagoides pteronyssinus TaxID=6956 RepID=A0ABQ8IS65_DERPT|nr:hypothetical protein DERP_006845 [Dermatophagoides pteronyssinus]
MVNRIKQNKKKKKKNSLYGSNNNNNNITNNNETSQLQATTTFGSFFYQSIVSQSRKSITQYPGKRLWLTGNQIAEFHLSNDNIHCRHMIVSEEPDVNTQ